VKDEKDMYWTGTIPSFLFQSSEENDIYGAEGIQVVEDFNSDG